MNIQSFSIKNQGIFLKIKSDQAIYITEFGLINGTASQQFNSETGSLLQIYDGTGKFIPLNFSNVECEQIADITEELITIGATVNENLHIRICILAGMIIGGNGKTVKIIVQASSDTEFPKLFFAYCPFLANLIPPGTNGTYYYPANPVALPDDSHALQIHPLCPFPYVLTDKKDELGFMISFPTLSELYPAVQNRNVDLRNITNKEQLISHRLPLRLGSVIADIFELEICSLENGWREAFSLLRKEFTEKLNLHEYRRSDIEWMKKTFLHHFSYVYGKETYNYVGNKPDIEKLLDEGREFGGYDSVTLWHQYPRLGVDRRNQWDFFYDFPGGIQGLREVADATHRHGVKFFLPYKPWDIGINESMEGVSEKLEQLADLTGLDGLFLDTMQTVPAGFREALDKAHPGIAFMSEGEPQSRQSLEVLTGSWEQYFDNKPECKVNCLRFVLPGHISPFINRWALNQDKNNMIVRAMFSGSGLVIWQDIFGVWLPFTTEQKRVIKKYKSIWTNNREVFLGSKSIPFVPTENENILCNMFASDTCDDVIYVIYNYGRSVYSGNLVRHHLDNRNIQVLLLWGA